MTKLVLIDHSLKRVGGHNHDYAVNVLHAAQRAGQEVVLATHRIFRRQVKQVGDYQVFPTFRYDTFTQHSLFTGGTLWDVDDVGPKTSSRYFPLGGAAHIRNAWRRMRGRQIIDSFAISCRQLFDQVNLQPGDCVFLPTISEFDLLGLVQYLKADSQSRRAQWILQFHFDVMSGRSPDYDSQAAGIEKLRRHFLRTLSEVPQHRFVFLNPTQRMADQYNRLQIARFAELPYPVNEAFRPRPSHPAPNEPLRITCAGHFRREKGRRALSTTVDAIWDGLLASGRAQLVLQGSAVRMLRMLPRRVWSRVKAHPGSPTAKEPLVVMPHPLARDNYVNFIRNAHVGLFLYDSQRYYARCSGILVEMLSSGVPVIVPAGSWLAEQIAEPNNRYLENLVHTRKTVSVRTLDDADVLGGKHAGRTPILTNDRGLTCPSSVELVVPQDATELLVGFRWKFPQRSGTYLRLEAENARDDGQALTHHSSVVGHRKGGCRIPVMFSLETHASKIRLNWSNAYHDGDVHVADVQFRFLSGATGWRERCPTGAVGLIAADTSQVPRLLQEMVSHYRHYRETAVEFSADWRQRHCPSQVVTRLMSGCRDS